MAVVVRARCNPRNGVALLVAIAALACVSIVQAQLERPGTTPLRECSFLRCVSLLHHVYPPLVVATDGPEIVSAVAANTGGQPGIGPGDTILLTFDVQTNSADVSDNEKVAVAVRSNGMCGTAGVRWDARASRAGSHPTPARITLAFAAVLRSRDRTWRIRDSCLAGRRSPWYRVAIDYQHVDTRHRHAQVPNWILHHPGTSHAPLRHTALARPDPHYAPLGCTRRSTQMVVFETSATCPKMPVRCFSSPGHGGRWPLLLW